MKLSLFTDDMVIYVKKSKRKKKLLELISDYNKFARYKLTYKSQSLSYMPATNERVEYKLRTQLYINYNPLK